MGCHNIHQKDDKFQELLTRREDKCSGLGLQGKG